MASADRTYGGYCNKCNEETIHVSIYPGYLQKAFRICQIAVFFTSFGIIYPQIFAADDQMKVKCTKCGTHGSISSEKMLAH